MKNITTTLTLAALLPLAATAATFNGPPVGYSTATAAASSFSFLGINFIENASAVGTADTPQSVASEVADADALFTSTVPATAHIEITSGASAGTISEITGVTSDTVLTTADDISAAIDGQSYEIRANATLGSLFGAANDTGFQESSSSAGADVIWVSNGAGGFNKYFYNDGTFFLDPIEGWRQDGAGTTDQAGAPLLFTDAIIVERKGATDLDIVISGKVKLTSTSVDVAGGAFNFVSAISPDGLTLGDLLGAANEAGLQESSSSAGADVVWAPNGAGGFNQYFYNDGTFFLDPIEGWRLDGAGTADQAGAVMPSAVIIERKGGALTVELGVPAAYSSL